MHVTLCLADALSALLLPLPDLACPTLPLQANAVPSSFWSVAFLLLPENQRLLQAVVAKAQQAIAVHVRPAAAAAAGEGVGVAAAQAGAEAAAVGAGAGAGAALEGEVGAGELLSVAQQQGLVALAVDRHSHAAAAVAEALRLCSFRCCPPAASLLLPACLHARPPARLLRLSTAACSVKARCAGAI
jgi:hypothetical protein